jgi:tripartite-type tricarboxylate transporter receptor subunit TctC
MRRLPVAVLALLASVAHVSAAETQPYPARPIRILVASSPGSAADIVARIVAQKLPDVLGQQIVIDNRAGAGGNLGAQIAAQAAPDGYTLFLGTPAHVIHPSLTTRPLYDLGRDFAPISLLTSGVYVIVVNPRIPVKSLKELIAYLRSNPGRLNYASAGTGNATHLAGELFRIVGGVDIVHVPYKGSGPALAELVGGQVDMMFANLAAAQGDIQSGKLRALAVTGPKRSVAAPQLPTASEAGLPGYEVTSWFGVLAPKGTQTMVIASLNKSFVQVLNMPEAKERLVSLGAEPVGSSPQAFVSYIKEEVARWGKVIKAAGIKAEN